MGDNEMGCVKTKDGDCKSLSFVKNLPVENNTFDDFYHSETILQLLKEYLLRQWKGKYTQLHNDIIKSLINNNIIDGKIKSTHVLKFDKDHANEIIEKIIRSLY